MPPDWDVHHGRNDLPRCPRGGLLSGTEGPDQLAGEDGEDEIRGLGARDFISGGAGNDIIYGGPGDNSPMVGDECDDVVYGGDGDEEELGGGKGEDVIYGGDGNDDLDGASVDRQQRDKLYCGEGKDYYVADENDYVDSSCEVKYRPQGRS